MFLPLNPLKGTYLLTKLMEPPLGDRASKIPPVAGFSEGASLQGRHVVEAGGKKTGMV